MTRARRPGEASKIEASQGVPDERCRRVVAMLLAGYRHREVARREGWTPAELWEYLGQPHVRKYRYEMLVAARDATIASVVAHAEDAVRSLAGGLRSDDERVRMEAARQILDRAGVVRTERIEQSHEVTAEASVVAALDAQLPRRMRLDADADAGWVASLAARAAAGDVVSPDVAPDDGESDDGESDGAEGDGG